jgi:hypothetical protein
LGTPGLDNVGSLTSHSPIGLYGLDSFTFLLYFQCVPHSFTLSDVEDNISHTKKKENIDDIWDNMGDIALYY